MQYLQFSISVIGMTKPESFLSGSTHISAQNRSHKVIHLSRYLAHDSDTSKSSLINTKRSYGNSLFEETSYKAIRIAQRRKWTLILLIVALILSGVGILIYHQITTSKHNQRVAEYSQIEDIYNNEVIEFQKKSATTQKNSLAANDTPNNSQSMEKFADFAKKYMAEPIGWQAALRASTFYISKDQNDKAKQLLESLVQHSGRMPIIQIKARTSLAGIYAAEKNTEKALNELKIVEQIPENPLPMQTKLFQAQILFLSGNSPEAVKVLNQIISSPNTGSDFQTQQQAKIWLNYIES